MEQKMREAEQLAVKLVEQSERRFEFRMSSEIGVFLTLAVNDSLSK